MAILAYLYSWVKPRQNRQEEQHSNKSFTSFMTKKRRTKSDLSKADDEHSQRQIMIRKSLQSRASSRATDRICDEFENDGCDTEEEDRNPGLKSDWKAYEADIQRNRSTLMRSHPGVDRSGRVRAGPSSRRPQRYSYGSSSTGPQSPTLSSTPGSPASPDIGRAF
ncbi:hypothetical protein NM208_g12559 [Fusarium decemcellulare]|uniref:Uncharacterized protein n=1 Tax=Fusarium decemcellulare TaxID=57161 RepID=A0ACC1RQV1_9HYPO|nr:hypothetical protein NM208_g12559 [Fusarium decemcellulare]